jgi:hypothetical protein
MKIAPLQFESRNIILFCLIYIECERGYGKEGVFIHPLFTRYDNAYIKYSKWWDFLATHLFKQSKERKGYATPKSYRP